jgi:hypothetical protein
MLELQCPNCRKLLQVVETATDRYSQCPSCGTVFQPNTVSKGLQSESPHPPTGAISAIPLQPTATARKRKSPQRRNALRPARRFWHQWLFWLIIAIVPGVVAFGLTTLWMTFDGLSLGRSVVEYGLGAALIFAVPGCCYIVFHILFKAVDGFLKAAGRRTSSSSEEIHAQPFDDHPVDEELQ